MAEVAVDVQDVSKRFPNPGGGWVTAVDHVSLRVEDGEFFSLLGPSGCGKSTLLRMVAGLELPTEGSIAIHGRDMTDVPPYLRPVNMVFQSYALFPHMTIHDNVAFGLEMAHRPPAEIRRRVAEALEMVQLPDMGPRKPDQLSGGQQQRVALARAIVNRPEVLLLDEPLGALDLKLRKEMQIELKELQQTLGITFLYVTHDQEEALTMSNRIGVMSAGKILQVGPPAEIYERPGTRFVADFIGEANFLDGRVAAIEGGVAAVVVEGLVGDVRGLAHSALVVGTKATLAVRPEKIKLLPREDAKLIAATNAFAGTVVSVDYIGSDTRVMVHLEGGPTLAAWEPNSASTLDPDAYYDVGETVWLTWESQNALVLAD